ncbi:hypothetical protein BXU10_21210 [Flavobacterium sp. LM4]|nr:hypothetical protein BXU10_21210 [Flavobacterium sp. LM4]
MSGFNIHKPSLFFKYILPFLCRTHVIYQSKKNNRIVGEYLIAVGLQDTVVLKIEKRNKKSLVLLNSKNIQKVFNFWKIIKFHEK